jgi:hypothetical protein
MSAVYARVSETASWLFDTSVSGVTTAFHVTVEFVKPLAEQGSAWVSQQPAALKWTVAVIGLLLVSGLALVTAYKVCAYFAKPSEGRPTMTRDQADQLNKTGNTDEKSAIV